MWKPSCSDSNYQEETHAPDIWYYGKSEKRGVGYIYIYTCTGWAISHLESGIRPGPVSVGTTGSRPVRSISKRSRWFSILLLTPNWYCAKVLQRATTFQCNEWTNDRTFSTKNKIAMMSGGLSMLLVGTYVKDDHLKIWWTTTPSLVALVSLICHFKPEYDH